MLLKTFAMSLSLLLVGCGPKTIYQEKYQKEHQAENCDELYKEYMHKRNLLAEETKKKKIYGDPHDMSNWTNSHTDSRGNIFYSIDNEQEAKYKWELESIINIMDTKKCQHFLPEVNLKTSYRTDVNNMKSDINAAYDHYVANSKYTNAKN